MSLLALNFTSEVFLLHLSKLEWFHNQLLKEFSILHVTIRCKSPRSPRPSPLLIINKVEVPHHQGEGITGRFDRSAELPDGAHSGLVGTSVEIGTVNIQVAQGATHVQNHDSPRFNNLQVSVKVQRVEQLQQIYV